LTFIFLGLFYRTFDPLSRFLYSIMMSLSNGKNTINDRTISASHALAYLKVVLYLRLKFSIKIVTTLAK
jgi:hypothetical protein